MAKLRNKVQIVVKPEVTPGTFVLAAPAAADVVPRIFDPSFDPDFTRITNNIASAVLNKQKSRIGGRRGSFTFSMELIGAAAAGTATVQRNVWLMCGYDETVSAGTSVAYQRGADVNDTKFSVGLWKDGVYYGLAGCVADAVITHNAGEVSVMQVTVQGVWQDPADLAAVTPPAQPILPAVVEGLGLLISGEDLCWTNLSVNVGNAIQVPRCGNHTGGFRDARISDADPSINIDPEVVDVATVDFFDLWKQKTDVPIAFTIPGTAGNILSLAATTAIDDIDDGERDDFDIYDLDLEVVAAAGAAEGADLVYTWT